MTTPSAVRLTIKNILDSKKEKRRVTHENCVFMWIQQMKNCQNWIINKGRLQKKSLYHFLGGVSGCQLSLLFCLKMIFKQF